MSQFTREQKRRLFEIGNLTKKYIYLAAKSAEYNGPKSHQREIEEYLLSIDEDLFEKVCKNYINAENSSNYIFVIKKEDAKKLKEDLPKILKKLPNAPSNDLDNFFLNRSYYDEELDEDNIRLKKVKFAKVIELWNFEKEELDYQDIYDVETFFIKIFYKHNLILVRTRSLASAKRVLSLIITDFSAKINIINFSKTDIIKIIEYMTILRGARLRYESDDEIQSASYSAGESEKDGILKNLKKSAKFKKDLEEGQIRNCRFSIARRSDYDSDKLTSKDVITLGINFMESKIYFSTRLDEEETIEWILNILSNINLESKTKKDYKKEFL